MIPNFMLCSLILLLTFTVTTLGHERETVTPDRRYNVLRFGNSSTNDITTEDYIMFRPNMQPVQQAFSVCSWIKKRRYGAYRTWFDYATSSHQHEIRLTDDGNYNYIHNSNGLHLRSKFTVALGTWFHYCLTWATAFSGSGTNKRVFLNGELVGSERSNTNAIELGGSLVLGYNQNTVGGSAERVHEIFGGELYKLNVYAKELNATEVKEMSDGGLCSEVEEKYGFARYLKWEDILLQERNGNVTEQNAGCHKVEEEETNETESDTECECSGQQNATTSTSRWNILKLDTFYNKTLTHDLLDQLRTGWNILEDFIGATVNDGFIRHFTFFHKGKACDDA